MNIDKLSNDILLHKTKEMQNCGNTDAYRIVAKIAELSSQPPKNAFAQIREWRKLGEKMILYITEVSKQVEIFERTTNRYESEADNRKNQRWTPQEDELLIEMVCADRHPFEISSTLGRTVPSIKTRVSKLVGLKRISQEIAGKFIGTFNGIEMEGDIEGTLYKENNNAEEK